MTARACWVGLFVVAAVGCRGAAEAGAEAGSGGEDAAGARASSASAPLSLEDARREYRGWMQRSAMPRAISGEIFALCRLPSLPETEFTKSAHGGDLALLDWANEDAARVLDANARAPFPVGAAIVKEKFRGAELVALGIMIKRAAGFDAAIGDWEFGYWEAESGLSSGSEPARACGGCHAGSTTDFVFVDASWRSGR